VAEEPEPKKKARKAATTAKPRKPAAKPAKKPKKPKAKPKPKVAPTPSPMPKEARDIGIDVPPPAGTCTDRHCPFHGSLRVRGQILQGVVVSAAMMRTVVVERARLRYVPKYERFEKRTGRVPAHAPPCLGLTLGSRVTLMECRPLSKTVSFVAIHNRGVGG